MANINNVTEALNALKDLAEGLPEAVKVDDMLIVEGAAADAKAVGEAIDGITLAKLGVTAAVGELNKMDGVIATTAELNYIHGVTSNIQTQLNAKVESNHIQAASTISAGTFAGRVVANSSVQAPATALLRNSRIVHTETNPSNNGEICWVYS